MEGGRSKAKRERGKGREILLPYHDAAATIFSGGRSHTQEEYLLQAAKEGDLAAVQSLLKHATRQNLRVDVKHKESGDTPLILASRGGHSKVVSYLLSRGADVTLQNDDGTTALEAAADDETRKIILGSVTRQGITCRHLLQAAWQGDIRIVRRLLAPGNKGIVDINHRNADGFTPLLLVTRDLQLFQKLEFTMLKNYKPADVVTHLIKHQADMNASDELGRTALHFAATSGGTFGQHIVAVLLEEGTEIDLRDHHFNAPIHFASGTGDVNMIEFLIDKGANVNAPGRDGSTPLHFSAEGGHEEASDSLLDHGADITLANERGQTPVDVAKGQRLKSRLREAWTESTTKLHNEQSADSSVEEESVSADQQDQQDLSSDGELPGITPDSLSPSDNESSFFVTQKSGSPKKLSPTEEATDVHHHGPNNRSAMKVIDMDAALGSSVVPDGLPKLRAPPQASPSGSFPQHSLTHRRQQQPVAASVGLARKTGVAVSRQGSVQQPADLSTSLPQRHTHPKKALSGSRLLPGRRQQQLQQKTSVGGLGQSRPAGLPLAPTSTSMKTPVAVAMVQVGFVGNNVTIHRWMNPGFQSTQPSLVEGTRTRSRSQSQPETTLGSQFSQTLSIPPKKLSGLPLKSHLYQRPSRPTVLEPLNHISPVNFDIPVWPSAQSPKLETIRSSILLSRTEDGRSDGSESTLYSHSQNSDMWHNPQMNDEQEEPRFKEPELQSETTLTPIHADVFGVGAEAVLESVRQVQLSPRSLMRRARSSPVPLNSLGMLVRSHSLVSSSSESTLDACASERDSERSLAGSTHLYRDSSLASILDNSSSDDSTIKATSSSSISEDQSLTHPRTVQKLVPLNPQPLVGSSHNIAFLPPLIIPGILSSGSETIVSYLGTRGSRPSTAATTQSVRTEAHSLSSDETGRPHSGDSGNGDSDAERERNGEGGEEEDLLVWKRGNLLGQGAYGRVWLGLTLTGEMIAVKQVALHRDVEKAEKQYEKLQHEVGLLRSLSHSNIVGYRGTDFDETTRTVNIFMEFVPGGSITHNLKCFGAFDETVFRRYTRQILDGVEYLHEQGIVHRDIKGANVMICPSSVIKLIDFGCAKQFCLQPDCSLSQSGLFKSMVGTPYWMAPEVITESGYRKKSDIWSIGCTVFEMATSKPPFYRMEPTAALYHIGQGAKPPPLPASFSPAAISFVQRCLTRDINERPSAKDLQRHPFIKKR